MIEPAFKNKEKREVREARMELQQKLLLVFCDGELLGQCPWDHPALVRHIDQLERIHQLKIVNKTWMMREVEAIGSETIQETDQKDKD